MGKLEREVRTECLKGGSEGKVPRRILNGTVQKKVSREGLGSNNTNEHESFIDCRWTEVLLERFQWNLYRGLI